MKLADEKCNCFHTSKSSKWTSPAGLAPNFSSHSTVSTLTNTSWGKMCQKYSNIPLADSGDADGPNLPGLSQLEFGSPWQLRTLLRNRFLWKCALRHHRGTCTNGTKSNDMSASSSRAFFYFKFKLFLKLSRIFITAFSQGFALQQDTAFLLQLSKVELPLSEV